MQIRHVEFIKKGYCYVKEGDCGIMIGMMLKGGDDIIMVVQSSEVDNANRHGILLEVVQILTDLNLVITKSYISSDGGWFMDEGGYAITDVERLSRIKEPLRNVLGSSHCKEAKTEVSHVAAHLERRLHQIMFDDRDYDYEQVGFEEDEDIRQRSNVSVLNWYDKDYSIISVRSKDRPKLPFDTVCTLTDMQYVVFHGSVDAQGPKTYQEYYIRHVNGSPIKSKVERQRVIQYLEAAIKRRVSEGLKLELCTTDRAGLLFDVLLESSARTVTQAEVITRGGKAVYIFYVCNASGYTVDAKTIESIRLAIGQTILKVKGNNSKERKQKMAQESQSRFLFGGLFKSYLNLRILLLLNQFASNFTDLIIGFFCKNNQKA
ncbi:ACT domain-containing protein ACR4 [Bienertia sinuspersici]